MGRKLNCSKGERNTVNKSEVAMMMLLNSSDRAEPHKILF